MLSKVYCAACNGIEAYTVTIETDVSDGICFFLVGLPDSAVKESQQRIGSALAKFGYRIPGKRIVVNMAPASVRKEGSSFDMPIGLGIICASGQISGRGISQEILNEFIVMGELALDGSLRPMKGALPIAMHARECGFKSCIFPSSSAAEAAEVAGITVFGAQNVGEVIEILLSPEEFCDKIVTIGDDLPEGEIKYDYDFADVIGQTEAKRGLEIAAAGAHNVIMVGSPGCGKTFLAKAVPSILPPMDIDEALETGKIYSVSGLLNASQGLTRKRPFRSPHHSSTVASLVGGGINGLPGEISLAHNGVLFADEFPEFGRCVLEILRQPLEEGFVSISRVKAKSLYPASFMLIAAMNPCPCGHLIDDPSKCTCSSSAVAKYMGKISGPLMDRIDIQLVLHKVPEEALVSAKREEPSGCIAERVAAARKIQIERYKNEHFYTNSRIPPSQLSSYCKLGSSEKRYMTQMIAGLKISARGYSRILKISRTIADLDGEEFISLKHISEALQFRKLDKTMGNYL